MRTIFYNNNTPEVGDGKAEQVNDFICIGSNYWPHVAVVLSSLTR
jgi:hypothetical protein